MDYEKENSGGFMMKLAAFIVDKRNLVFLLVGIFMIFSLFARNWVEVENDLTAYLPSDSKTKEGLEVMEQQFITYGSADLMVANISYEEANALFEKIKVIEGVQSVAFDDTTEHYSKASALFSVTTPPLQSCTLPSLPMWMPPPLLSAWFCATVPPCSFRVPCT